MIGTYMDTSGTQSLIVVKDWAGTGPRLYVLQTAIPAGINPGDFVYFDAGSAPKNLATNVRAAIKTVTRSPQGFEIDTWS